MGTSLGASFGYFFIVPRTAVIVCGSWRSIYGNFFGGLISFHIIGIF